MLSGRPRRTRTGFTLIELTAAIAVTAIIGSMAAAILIESSRVRAAVSVRTELSDDAVRTVELMLRYVREIEQDAGLTGLAQIGAAEGSRISFGSNAFRLNGALIEMSVDGQGTWQALARNIQSLSLRYYRADGTELTPAPLTAVQCQQVRQVSVDVRMSRGTEGAHARSRAYLRSFMNETS